MSDFQEIIYQKHHRVRGAAWITINRPEVMNAFTGQTLTEMRQAVEDACADPEVGVIVITGTGERAFFASGEADEGKNAFLERREPDFSRFPR
jgi:2-ketocyclohexanecarboxyl-CoA hydrolase